MSQAYPFNIMIEDLLPCPFCGSKPEMVLVGNEFTVPRSVIIKCPNCGVQRKDSGIITPLYTLAKGAVERWNTRTEEQSLKTT